MIIRNIEKGIRSINNKNFKTAGFTFIELVFVIAIGSLLAFGAITQGPKLLDKTKVSIVRSDLKALETSCTQMLYEYDGATRTDASTDAAKFAEIFNKYVDSNTALGADGVLARKDQWGRGYVIKYKKISGSEATILIESLGKLETKPSHALLVHYKDAEVRSGTAGFDVNEGSDTSDAAYSETNGATITTLWKTSTP